MTGTTGGMGWKELRSNILLVLVDSDDFATDTDADDAADDDDDDEENKTHNINE